MKITIAIFMALSFTQAFAHPSGNYMIDNDPEVTITIQRVKTCTQTEEALKGALRTFTFSEKATQSPYNFVSSFYVEIHREIAGKDTEVYVQTNDKCVPVRNGQEYEAERRSLGGFEIKRIR